MRSPEPAAGPSPSVHGTLPGSLPQPTVSAARRGLHSPLPFLCVNAASRLPNLCFEYSSVFSLPRLCWLLPSVLFLSQYDKLYPCSPYLILVSSSFQNARSPVSQLHAGEGWHPQQGARSVPQGKGSLCWPDENQALLMMLVFFLPALYAPLPLFGPAPGGPPEGTPNLLSSTLLTIQATFTHHLQPVLVSRWCPRPGQREWQECQGMRSCPQGLGSWLTPILKELREERAGGSCGFRAARFEHREAMKDEWGVFGSQRGTGDVSR